MNGEGVSYPAFLLGRLGAKPKSFEGPEALFISDRYRPPVGKSVNQVLVDVSGRSWTLHRITAVGRWGSWRRRLSLWWRRQYLVEYEATEGPVLSFDQVKARLLDSAEKIQANLYADSDIDRRGKRSLKDWKKVPELVAEVDSYEELGRAMIPRTLTSDGWFRSYGRSNRTEYLTIVVPALTLIESIWYFRFGFDSELAFAASIVLGVLLPSALIFSAMLRRIHDFAFSGILLYFVSLLWFCWPIARDIYAMERFVDRPGGATLLAGAILVLALAIPPGTQGRNRHGPPPNPGPSL